MNNKEVNIPELRFPKFHGKWNQEQVKNCLIREDHAVNVEPKNTYREIGIRSHGKGLFHKQEVKGIELGNKRVFKVQIPALILNIVFAWEQAVAVTTENEKGFIASHRFPMFVPKNNKVDLYFILYFFMRQDGKNLLELASPGGAGRNKTLGQKSFSKLKLTIPSILEQQEIANFVSAISKRIEQNTKKRDLLIKHKLGLLQNIFNQKIRFNETSCEGYSDWKEVRLSDVLFEHKLKNTNKVTDEVFSVAKTKGVINQIEHLGRSYAASSIDHYKIVEPYDVIYTKSPTGNFPYGIIKQNLTERTGVVSPLYAVLKPLNANLGYIIHSYFYSDVNTYNYLNPLVHKGAKNTININNNAFLSGAKIKLPTDEIEQKKIADFLKLINVKIDSLTSEIDKIKSYKQGLLQQMFI